MANAAHAVNVVIAATVANVASAHPARWKPRKRPLPQCLATLPTQRHWLPCPIWTCPATTLSPTAMVPLQKNSAASAVRATATAVTAASVANAVRVTTTAMPKPPHRRC